MKYASKHTAYIFYKNHICFFLCVLKKQAHCTYCI